MWLRIRCSHFRHISSTINHTSWIFFGYSLSLDLANIFIIRIIWVIISHSFVINLNIFISSIYIFYLFFSWRPFIQIHFSSENFMLYCVSIISPINIFCIYINSFCSNLSLGSIIVVLTHSIFMFRGRSLIISPYHSTIYSHSIIAFNLVSIFAYFYIISSY